MTTYVLLAGLLFTPVYADTQVQYVMTTVESIKDYISARAIAHNTRPDVAVEIAHSESLFNINAKNASSTASGLFEFIDGTFKSFCIDTYHLTNTMEKKNDPFIQTECAVTMLSQGLSYHWDASKNGWGPTFRESTIRKTTMQPTATSTQSLKQ